MEEFDEVKVKIEPIQLDEGPCTIEFTTFICQPDLDIKQENKEPIQRPSKGDTHLVDLPLPMIPLVTEDKEEVLGSKMKLPMIVSAQSVVPSTMQLVSISEYDSKCTSVLIDIPMTESEKQNRKCPKAMAVMKKPPLLSALYKCPIYECSFATMLPVYFKKHFATHLSILMDTLVPCLYCDYKVSYSFYMTHLEVRHGHCLFGCGDCFYRTTNSYFITMHRELMHPNTEFNILQLEVVTSIKINTDTSSPNVSKLVPPYNCKDDGFLGCSFKTLYFDEYLKHIGAIHQVDGHGWFSSEHEPQKEAVMEGWLAKEVGPFQCRYCKKATVTHQEMGRHQAVFHAQEQCLFYYRKFVPNDTVITPEQVNLEDPSFINHVIHLPNQVHLCNFKLMDVKEIKSDPDQSSVSVDEPETFNMLVKDEPRLLDESDSCLNEQTNYGGHNDAMITTCKCKWKDCYQIYDSQMALVKHIEKNHVKLQSGKEFICFWNNCLRKLKPYANKQNLLRHMRIHSGEKPYKCAYCNKGFPRMGTLKIHQRSHTGEKPYVCQFSNCSKSFFTSTEKKYHQRMHYDTEAYACQVTGCSRKYGAPRNLLKHMKKHTIDEQLEAKQKWLENKRKKGDFVLKKSSNTSDGTKHHRIHCDTLQCKWNSCQQTYDSQTILVKHIEKSHVRLQKGEQFTCFWINCPRKSKPFSTKYELLRHMRIHSKEKPYKCPGCNKTFSQLGHLNIHQRKHTGERPFLCQFSNCFERFSSGYIRNYHQRLHYDPEAYACQVTSCSKKYKEPSRLQKHMKNHTIEEQLDAKQKSVEKNLKEDDLELKKTSTSLDGAKQQITH